MQGTKTQKSIDGSFAEKVNAKGAHGDLVDSDSFIAANPRSLLELDKPPRSIPISETGSVRSAQSLGSLPGSLRSSESDPATWTLPTLPWRDWELNLDDLRVCTPTSCKCFLLACSWPVKGSCPPIDGNFSMHQCSWVEHHLRGAWMRFTSGQPVCYDAWTQHGLVTCMPPVQVFLNDDGSEMELGRGGFGVVLRGTYRMAPVAIKRLKDQSLEQQEVFMREMALLRGCRGSRYIVPFVGASLQPVGFDNPLQRSSQVVRRLSQLGEHAIAVKCVSEYPSLVHPVSDSILGRPSCR